MTAAPASGWWRVCPGCGCERQLDRAAAANGCELMADHNRFDRDRGRGVMVRCEGSSRPPAGDTSSGGGHGEGDAA